MRHPPSRTLASWTLCLVTFFLACGGGDGPNDAETGALAVAVSGLPEGTPASITITGPGGFDHALAKSETLSGLRPGGYTITAASVSVSGAIYTPAQSIQAVNVEAGGAPTIAAVTYAPPFGILTLTVNGLPAGALGNVSVIGPEAFSATVTETQTLTGLVPGAYLVTAGNVTADSADYAPTPIEQTVQVSLGNAATAAVTYAPFSPDALNLRVDGLYLTQSVQTYSGSVPLIRDRNAYLRVFVKANQTNSVAPDVRVRLYHGGALVSTLVLSAPTAQAPTSINEGMLANSWNAAIPGSLVRPGLSILADVDPGNTVPEAVEGDNRFPTSGIPLALDVRTLPGLNIKMVPVRQSANGLTGNVNSANRSQFLATTQKLHPIPAWDADVRSAYTTSAPALTSDNSNGAWGMILGEINALRIADGSQRYYYGVVKTAYTSGVAGIGYVPGKAAVGWDFLPSGDQIVAHELGHNWGRKHSPCGNPSNVDPAFPYPDGSIGVYGLDVAAAALKPPFTADIMGYCGNRWTSDYTYLGVLNYRLTSGAPGVGSAGRSGNALLLWGRITSSGPVLEPAFLVPNRPLLPTEPGPYRVDGADSAGRQLFSTSFSAETVADITPNEEHFAFLVPLGAAEAARLTTLRLVGRGHHTIVTSPTAKTAGAPMSASAPPPQGASTDLVWVRWNQQLHPMVMVRDPRTGEVLSFARGGEVLVATGSRELELTFSDKVRSSTRTVRVEGR